MKKIKLVSILIFIIACSKITPRHEEHSQRINPNNDWAILNELELNTVNKEYVLNIFGTPREVFNDEKKKIEYLIYDDVQTKRQKWSLGINNIGKLTSITFIPNYTNREAFPLEILKNKWGEKCIKKKDVDISQHFIRNIYYLDCGEKYRAYLDKNDEVMNISITLIK
jgi:hypothetical protein